jgi:tripartite-type tricarboxylate transporter receptor subunit TctC
MRHEILHRLAVWATAAWAGVLLGFAPLASAQTGYPSKPVRLVLPFPPGGSTDTLARLLGQKLSDSWGKPVIVDNKPGAGGAIAADHVARAAPDGYTIFVGTIGDMAINPSLGQKLAYEPEKDFTAVGLLALTPLVLVTHPSLPANSVKELIDLAKAKPGLVSYLSVGPGSSQHLSGELFRKVTGTSIVHIPYKGGAPQTTALLAGQEQQFGFVVIGTALPHIQSGKLRALGISSTRRSAALPEVPTLDESGLPGFDTTPWYGLFAPTGTPKDIVAMVNAESTRAIKLPDVASRLTQLGFELAPSSPQALAAFLQSEITKYRKIIQESGTRGS